MGVYMRPFNDRLARMRVHARRTGWAFVAGSVAALTVGVCALFAGLPSFAMLGSGVSLGCIWQASWFWHVASAPDSSFHDTWGSK